MQTGSLGFCLIPQRVALGLCAEGPSARMGLVNSDPEFNDQFVNSLSHPEGWLGL